MESQKDPTPRHPIRVVANRTGLTTASLRAWERRYKAIKPERSQSGQRLYSDRDIQRLSLLRELTEAGRAISGVADLSLEQLLELAAEDRAAEHSSTGRNGTVASSSWLDEAFEQVVKLDARELERILWKSAMILGANRFIDELVTPLIHGIGSEWVSGQITPAQEHMGTEVVDRTLAKLTGPTPNQSSPHMLVATLHSELHGLGARLVSTVAALEGWKVTHLGTSLSATEIAQAAAEIDATAVAISVVNEDRIEDRRGDISRLRAHLDPSISVLVGGRASGQLEEARLAGVRVVLGGLPELRQICREAM